MATHNGIRHNGESPSTILAQLLAVDGSSSGFLQDSERGVVGGLVPIQTQAASSSATIDFTGLDDTYDGYMLVITSAIPATDDVEAWLRVGTGGTPTYQTSGYEYSALTHNRGGGAPGNVASSSDSHIKMCQANGTSLGIGNTAAKGGFSARVFFQDPEVSQRCQFWFNATNVRATDTTVTMCEGGGQYSTAGAITAIRFMFSSGNIASGRLTLYGYRKSWP